MRFTIVSGDAGRVAEIESIARRTWPSAYSEILLSGQIEYMLGMMYSHDALREQMSSKQHRFLITESVAEARGASVGFTSFQLDFPQPGITKIHKLYVLPEAQHLGVGKRLLDRGDSFLCTRPDLPKCSGYPRDRNHICLRKQGHQSRHRGCSF